MKILRAWMPLVFLSAIAGLLLSTGCSKISRTNTAAFEKAFSAKPAPGSTEDPIAKAACQEVLAALSTNGYVTAAESLSVLRHNPNLTVEQDMAVQKLFGDVQAKLAERAERGDKAAIQAIENQRSRGR